MIAPGKKSGGNQEAIERIESANKVVIVRFFRPILPFYRRGSTKNMALR